MKNPKVILKIGEFETRPVSMYMRDGSDIYILNHGGMFGVNSQQIIKFTFSGQRFTKRGNLIKEYSLKEVV